MKVYCFWIIMLVAQGMSLGARLQEIKRGEADWLTYGLLIFNIFFIVYIAFMIRHPHYLTDDDEDSQIEQPELLPAAYNFTSPDYKPQSVVTAQPRHTSDT